MNRHESGTHKNHAGDEGKFPLVPDLRREKRSRDIGELGQFAPRGYNQQGATGRSRLDKLVSDEDVEKSAGQKKWPGGLVS